MSIMDKFSFQQSTRKENTKSTRSTLVIFGISPRARLIQSKVRDQKYYRICSELPLIVSKGLADENEYLLIFDDGNYFQMMIIL